MNVIHKTICASLALASLACGAPLWAGESERNSALEINKANELLRGGDVDSALGAYQAASELVPESANLSYNTAVAQYRKGDVAAAEHLFQTAAATDDDAIAAKARYNLGNCDYASALPLAEKDRPAAIVRLESAITNYRSSLDVDPSDADARANIELASQLIDKLREEQKQDEQQQEQQQQKQDEQQKKDQQEQKDQQQSKDQQQQQDQQQKSEQQNSDQQKQDQQQQQSAQDKPQQGDDQSKQEQSKNDQSKEKQSSEDKAESQPQDPEDQQGQKDAAKKQSQQSRPQPSQQQQAAQQQEQNPPPQAEEPSDKLSEQPPQGELSAAGDKSDESDQSDKQKAAAFDPSKDGEMTQQEAEKMLQAIRDRDMIRRLRRQAAERNQHVPVDRDW